MYPQEHLTNHCEKCNLVHHPQTPCDEHAQLMYKVQQRAQWIIKSEEIARIRAEALKEAAIKARNAILDFGKGDTVSSWYSPMIRKEMAAQLAERAILGGTKRE